MGKDDGKRWTIDATIVMFKWWLRWSFDDCCDFSKRLWCVVQEIDRLATRRCNDHRCLLRVQESIPSQRVGHTWHKCTNPSSMQLTPMFSGVPVTGRCRELSPQRASILSWSVVGLFLYLDCKRALVVQLHYLWRFSDNGFDGYVMVKIIFNHMKITNSGVLVSWWYWEWIDGW